MVKFLSALAGKLNSGISSRDFVSHIAFKKKIGLSKTINALTLARKTASSATKSLIILTDNGLKDLASTSSSFMGKTALKRADLAKKLTEKGHKTVSLLSTSAIGVKNLAQKQSKKFAQSLSLVAQGGVRKSRSAKYKIAVKQQVYKKSAKEKIMKGKFYVMTQASGVRPALSDKRNQLNKSLVLASGMGIGQLRSLHAGGKKNFELIKSRSIVYIRFLAPIVALFIIFSVGWQIENEQKLLSVENKKVLGAKTTDNGIFGLSSFPSIGQVTQKSKEISVKAGTGIGVSTGPSFLVSNKGVLSLEGKTGKLSLVEGTGVDIDGLKISNSGVLSLQGKNGDLKLVEGDGISINGLTIINNDKGSSQRIFKYVYVSGQDTITAGSSTDTLAFSAGTGISLSTNSTDKKLTISSTSTGSSQWTTTGSDVYFSGGSVGVGDSSPLALLTVGSGDLFQVNSLGAIAAAAGITSSGSITFSTFTTNGGLLYTNGSGLLIQLTSQGSVGDCLISAGASAAPSFTSCPSGGANFWQLNSNALSPSNSTYDVMFGGTTTTSAYFSFLGNSLARGNQIASLSGDLVLDKAGSLQTTNKQTLTLGGATTGNITLSPLNGITGATVAPNTNNQVDLGTSSLQFRNIYAGTSLILGGATLQGSGGTITFPNATGTVCISTNNCSYQTTLDAFWNQGSGALFANNSTVDTLLGGQSSTSAAFRVVGQSYPLKGTLVAASVSANTSFAGFVVDNSGVGDLFSASKSGATKFTLLNNGNINAYGTALFPTTLAFLATAARTITFPDATGTVCISTNNCSYLTGTNWFTTSSDGKALTPINSTMDFLIGGIATTSADFAIIGLSSLTHQTIATISGNLVVVPNNGFGGGASLSAQLVLGAQYNPTIQTTANQLLTLGGNTTGDIQFKPGNSSTSLYLASNGRLGFGTTSPLTTFDLRGNSGTLGIASISGTTSFASIISNNDGVGDLFSASKSGATKFTLLNNGNINAYGTALFPTTLAFLATAARTITFPDATGTVCISTNNCSYLTGTNWFTTSSDGKALTPINSTMDFLIGGIATTSADFAVLNINGSGPATASVSGNLIVMPNNGAGGLVGIGTNLPVTKLQIVGGTDADLTTNTGYFVLGTTSSTNVVFDDNEIQARNNGAGSILKLQAQGGALMIGGGSGVNTALANIDIRQIYSGTLAVASVSGTTSFASLVVDQSGVGDVFSASAAGNPLFVIKKSGNVGIGTTIPLFKLDLQDNQSATVAAQIFNTNTGTNADGLTIKLGNTSTTVASTTNHFISFETSGIGIVGSIQGNGGKNVAYVTNGVADFAEYMSKNENENIPFGSVICQGKDGLVHVCQDDLKSIVGVASEFPTFVGGENKGGGSITVGLSGQVPVFVSTVNGNIESGDMITSGSGGVGVKAIKAGTVVGRALESYSGTGTGKIMIVINVTWYDPDIYVALDGSVGTKNAYINPIAGSPTLNVLADMNSTNTYSTQSSEPQNYASASSLNDLLDKFNQLKSRVDSLEEQKDQSSSSAILRSMEEAAVLSDTTTLTEQSATLSGSLSVLGRTVLSDLGVTGNIVTGLLAIHGLDDSLQAPTINSLGDLYLQNNRLGGIDILDGKIKIDKSGNVNIDGQLTAKKLNIDESDETGKSIGEGVIHSGETAAEISSSAVNEKSRIFTTSKTKGSGTIYVTSKTAGKSFKVEIDNPIGVDVNFDWWIVN